MVNRRTALSTVLIFFGAAATLLAAGPDYSKEAAVVQSMTTAVAFSSDGARHVTNTLSIRVQSEAAVRQFGVLSFPYSSGNEQIKIDYIRVKKADGSVVETPESAFMDVASEVASVAPMYTDIRQKQVPVKALGAGDVLEYSAQSTEQKPEIPGHFWYYQILADNGVILSQTVEIRVPKDKYVQVVSPKLAAEKHSDGNDIVYSWRYSRLEASKPAEKKKNSIDDAVKIQLTTFHNWQEVGNWWAALAEGRTEVTPAIQAKAKELTAGLTNDLDKAKAIYLYVSLKFRYISISLGAGRYRPHSAAEVIANQYGDCKDKHTLFAALLKAAGIQAWPALIGAGIKFDESVPSPAQFNHMITVLPQNGKYLWLDTTAEVAPFGLLNQAIRDEQALVIPPKEKPLLLKTPLDPPFQSANTFDVKASLTADGTFTGHFDFRFTGDESVPLRAAFRRFAPVQWPALAQQLSRVLGFGGDVSDVNVENLEDLDKPFHYSYEYVRKNYSDWENHQISLPPLPLGFGPGDEAEKPKESFWAGDPGENSYRISLHLPAGFTTQVPANASAKTDFADYSATYSLKDGTLAVERKMALKQSKVKPEQWASYQSLAKEVKTDQSKFLSLSSDSGRTDVTAGGAPEANRLMQQVGTAFREQKDNEARDLLRQVEQVNAKQPGLWTINAELALRSGNTDEAAADCRKEMEYHPTEIPPYQILAGILTRTGRKEEAVEVWRSALTATPDQPVAAGQLAASFKQAGRFAEIPPIVEKAIAVEPNNYYLRALRAEALLHTNHKEEGDSEALKISEETTNPILLNDLAYAMANAGSSAIDKARHWMEGIVSAKEQTVSEVSFATLSGTNLADVVSLANEWDTLGWIYFKQSDLAKAEKFIAASWNLSQHAEVGGHLARIYDKQGKRADAIAMWRLALASDPKYEESHAWLKKISQPDFATPGEKSPGSLTQTKAGEELGLRRTVKIPSLPKQKASAEFFVLLGKNGLEDAEFISGSDSLKNTGDALKKAAYTLPFPDTEMEKVIRRGILSCSEVITPSCQFTLLLPSTAATSKAEQGVAPASITRPSLISKVEPQYTKAAREAKLEGTVGMTIIVDEKGVPYNVSVARSLGLGLDENARAAVLKWRFKPGTRNGQPVSTNSNVEVNFRLLQKPETSAESLP